MKCEECNKELNYNEMELKQFYGTNDILNWMIEIELKRLCPECYSKKLVRIKHLASGKITLKYGGDKRAKTYNKNEGLKILNDYGIKTKGLIN